MNKTIREASTYLTGLLPPDSENFTSDDLLRFGMPDFVVRRIKLDVADRLASSLAMPTTEWLDGNRESVRGAWMQFKRHVADDAQLPRRHAAEIIDNAVIETVELIITPRRRVVEWIFGHAQEVPIATVRERSAYVTVNRYLTDALIRYMERKDMHVITRVAASEVVQMVDERYVSGFMPLSWAQLVDPLFQLARNRVDSDLIHDFFVDKGRDDLAELFPEKPIRIERVQFIEKLTIGREREQEPEKDQEPEKEREPEQKELHNVSPVTLNELVRETESAEPIIDQIRHEAEPGDDHPAMSAVPIWQQFLNDVPDSIDEEEVESISDDEPLVSTLSDMVPLVTAEPVPSVSYQKAKLVDWLKPDENAYIDSLFDGNELSYFQTVAELESCSSWSEVQVMLKEWVRSSHIDLHNADLAQLVDQLQTYFSTNDI